jgi:hypothetical protein
VSVRVLVSVLVGAFSALTPGLTAFGQTVRPEESVQELAFACGGARGGGVETWCFETVLAAQAARGGLGLAGTLGGPVPGSASTLGRRLRSFPRISVALRGGLTRLTLPDLSGGRSLPRGETTSSLTSLTLSTSLGLFHGLSLAPTVGGIFSFDLLGSLHLVSAPETQGFRDGVKGWGGGARLGILRESFTLPGISLSATYHALGESGLGDVEAGDPAQARFDTDVLSLRGTVGKDLLGVGLLAGLGWDRHGGSMAVRVLDPDSGLQGGASVDDFTSHRFLYFAGASMTYLILQVSAEGGWARGFDPDVPGRPGGTFDPASRTFFGSLGLRITF